MCAQAWVNEGKPFTFDGVSPSAKFFVNAEGKDTQFEIMYLD
jgi:hypothetical protein